MKFRPTNLQLCTAKFRILEIETYFQMVSTCRRSTDSGSLTHKAVANSHASTCSVSASPNSCSGAAFEVIFMEIDGHLGN